MKSLEVIIVDYHRKGNAARISQACHALLPDLGLAFRIHIIRPPEAESPKEEFPEDIKFWELDRNHGAQNRYCLAGEIQSEWSLYLDNNLIPTENDLRKLLLAVQAHGDLYSCYGWIGHNKENVRGHHLFAEDSQEREVDYILRAYLFRSDNVKSALVDFPVFHWEDDLNMQIKIQKRLKRPSLLVTHQGSLIDLGGHDEVANYREADHFERRVEMVSQVESFLSSPRP